MFLMLTMKKGGIASMREYLQPLVSTIVGDNYISRCQASGIGAEISTCDSSYISDFSIVNDQFTACFGNAAEPPNTHAFIVFDCGGVEYVTRFIRVTGPVGECSGGSLFSIGIDPIELNSACSGRLIQYESGSQGQLNCD